MTATGSTSTIDQLEARLQRLESLSSSGSAPTPAVAPPSLPSLWITNALQSITLAAIVGCAFWCGSLSSTVSSTSAKLDKLTDAISGVSKESLSNRTSVVESRLSGLEIKLDERTDALEKKLDEINRKLDNRKR